MIASRQLICCGANVICHGTSQSLSTVSLRSKASNSVSLEHNPTGTLAALSVSTEGIGCSRDATVDEAPLKLSTALSTKQANHESAEAIAFIGKLSFARRD
jgi:hypothetical protein